MKLDLDIPDEVATMLASLNSKSARPVWTFQAGQEYTTLKLTWRKTKIKAKSKSERKAEKRKPGGELTHPPPRVPVPATTTTSAVPDPPEPAPAPRRTRRKTRSRYRRSQRRYRAWKEAKSRPVPDPPGTAMDTASPPVAAPEKVSDVVPDTLPVPTKDPSPPSTAEEVLDEQPPSKKQKKNGKKKKKPAKPPTPPTSPPPPTPPTHAPEPSLFPTTTYKEPITPTPPHTMDPTLAAAMGPEQRQEYINRTVNEPIMEAFQTGRITTEEEFMEYIRDTFVDPDIQEIAVSIFSPLAKSIEFPTPVPATSGETITTPKRPRTKNKGKGRRK